MNKLLLLPVAAIGLAVGLITLNNRSDASDSDETKFPTSSLQSSTEDEGQELTSLPAQDASPQSWPEAIEAARQLVLNRETPLDEKSEALKALHFSKTENYEDPRSEAILDEAVWILANSGAAEDLSNALAGIEGVNYEPLIEPVIACLLNHKNATVRQNAVRVLKNFRSAERVKITLDHAAQYDESEFVRDEARATP